MNNLSYVSVVIPTYNHGEYIKNCLQSVIEQTFSDWEAIVVNNFSEDNTIEIVNSFQDSRIRLINFKNNGIIAASRNHGIRHARGKYIAFIDSDDIWMPEKLEKQVNQMEANNETLLSYVLYSWMFDDGTTKGIWPKPKNRFRGHIFKSLYLKYIIPNSGVMVRKEVFNQLGFLDENPKLVAAEDSDMWLRIARTGMIDYINDSPLLLYRVREGSTSKGLLERWKKHMFVAKKFAPHAGISLYILTILISTTNICKLMVLNHKPDSTILNIIKSWWIFIIRFNTLLH